ncbi:MAG: SDR family oxidoreductase [Planctomycetota bacterium]
MALKIDGVVALVTGANRGIGKAITDTLLKHGASKVYAAVRDPASAQPLVDAHGEKVVPIEFDLSKPEQIAAAAGAAPDAQLVVNNGGVLKNETPLSPTAFDALDFELGVNVYGFLRTAQAFAPVLKANGGGALVQLNSVVSLKSFPQFSTYSASKAASYSLTQSLRESLAEQGTQVVSVHPGPIATDMGHEAGLDEVAEPPELVGEAIVEALESGAFHAYPDTMAKQIGGAYAGFAEAVVLAEMSEG